MQYLRRLEKKINNEGLPWCLESELAVLSLLVENNTVLEVLTEAGVTTKHFHSNINRDIFKICCEVFDNGTDLDAYVVMTKLKLRHEKEIYEKRVKELFDANVYCDALKNHLQNLLEFKIRRDFVNQGHELVKKGFSDNGEIALLASELLEPPEDELTASSLMKQNFPEPKYIVPGIITEGVNLITGKPKLGKSLIMLNIAIAVASGGAALGQIPVEKKGVLYLGLEDTKRRLQKRIKSILQNQEPPPNLFLKTDFKTIECGGMETLDAWLKKHSDVALVIIDTLGKIKGKARRNSDAYIEDYAAIGKIKKIADERDISIVLVHHNRKVHSDDVLDMVLGSTALTGAVDTVIVMQKKRGQADAFLNISGRDLDEAELAIRFDKLILSWTLLGDASEYNTSIDQAEIMDLFRKNDGRPLSIKEISTAIGKKNNNTWNIINKLVDKDLLYKLNAGIYALNT